MSPICSFDSRIIIVGYYSIIELACAYNIDDLYHVRGIDARKALVENIAIPHPESYL